MLITLMNTYSLMNVHGWGCLVWSPKDPPDEEARAEKFGGFPLEETHLKDLLNKKELFRSNTEMLPICRSGVRRTAFFCADIYDL